MKNILKIVLLISLLCLLAEGLYRLLFFQHDRHAYSAPLAQMIDTINATGADILYLGESSNHTFGLDDVDTAWISEKISAPTVPSGRWWSRSTCVPLASTG